MASYWAMKTFKDWSSDFINQGEIGIDESEINKNFNNCTHTDLAGVKPSLVRKFNEFCKWMNVGDYVIIGEGQMVHFNIKIICRVTGDYMYDPMHQSYRHFRKIEVLKTFDEPVAIEKWKQVTRIERVDENDFIDTLIKSI